MGLFTRKPKQDVEPRRSLSLDEWANFFNYGNMTYFLTGSGTLNQGREEIPDSFRGFVDSAYRRNGVVFACIAARMLIFSEARFRYQQLRGGRPGDLFGSSDLDILERPWPNATTGDLLSRMLLDADIAGNAFVRRIASRRGAQSRLMRLRPDWVTIIGGSDGTLEEAEVLGYSYQPGGPGSGIDPVTLLPEEVAHFAPYPDPTAHFRGTSWIATVITDIMADGAAMNHKLKFFENGATPNTVVTLGDTQLTPQAFEDWVDKMEDTHAGSANAYKTWYLAAGADAKVIGSDLKNIDFEAVQGAGETRIAAAARIPPVLVGLSEGLDSATYSNYALAKRAFADGTIRPMWRNVAGSLSSIVNVPSGSRLWYDDRDIPFLQEDLKDEAEIQQMQAATITTLVRDGFTADSAIKAVTNGDMTMLQHTGMVSVQLQVPGSEPSTPDALPNGNGKPLALPPGATN